MPLPLSTTSTGTQRARGGPRRPPLPPLLPLPPHLLFPHGGPRREAPHRPARDPMPKIETTRGALRHGPAARVFLLLDQGLRVLLQLRRLVRSIQLHISRPRPCHINLHRPTRRSLLHCTSAIRTLIVCSCLCDPRGDPSAALPPGPSDGSPSAQSVRAPNKPDFGAEVQNTPNSQSNG